jgi:ABC-type glycerol-3-phosphate transport system permease component
VADSPQLKRAFRIGARQIVPQRDFFRSLLSAFIASYSSPEGLFWAKLSAASTMAIAPILILGWFSQRQLVRGLTFGAVK